MVVYLDDIIIFLDSLEEHRKHLELVLNKLRNINLFAKPSKCTFGVSELEFCGHIIEGG
jgi:putative transposase